MAPHRPCSIPTDTDWLYNMVQVLELLSASIVICKAGIRICGRPCNARVLHFPRLPFLAAWSVTRRWPSAVRPLLGLPCLRKLSLPRSHLLPGATSIQWLVNKGFKGLNSQFRAARRAFQLLSSMWVWQMSSLGFNFNVPLYPDSFSSFPRSSSQNLSLRNILQC